MAGRPRISDEELEHIKNTNKPRYIGIMKFRRHYARNKERICQKRREERQANLEACRKMEYIYRNFKKGKNKDESRTLPNVKG